MRKRDRAPETAKNNTIKKKDDREEHNFDIKTAEVIEPRRQHNDDELQGAVETVLQDGAAVPPTRQAAEFALLKNDPKINSYCGMKARMNCVSLYHPLKKTKESVTDFKLKGGIKVTLLHDINSASNTTGHNCLAFRFHRIQLTSSFLILCCLACSLIKGIYISCKSAGMRRALLRQNPLRISPKNSMVKSQVS